MIKKISFIFLLLALANCEGFKTHGKFITEHQDAWIDGYGPGGKPAFSEIDRESEADKGLLFCRANVNKDGTASPVCFKPTFNK